MTLLTLRIDKIGLKDAGQCIDPYMTISVKGMCMYIFLLLLQLNVENDGDDPFDYNISVYISINLRDDLVGKIL